MKQLLIVNSTAGKVNYPADLSTLANGAIAFFTIDPSTGKATNMASVGETNFGIVLGRPNGQVPMIIPEVDVKTLTIAKAEYAAGVKYKGEITIPTTEVGKTYTLILVKKGAVPHERNTWTATFTAKTTTATDTAKALRDYFNAMIDSGSLPFKKDTATTAKITLEANAAGDMWTLVAGDDLRGTTVTNTEGKKAVGDKAYVEELASKCAAGKGFTDTYANGATTIPGYPETVEDVHYNIYTLRFAVSRAAAKTRDEVVNQVVHIASVASLDAVLMPTESNENVGG